MVVVILISIAFGSWSLAALCNSTMDTITHHWWNCLFNSPKFNEAFWNPDSKKPPYIIPYTKYKVNAWHLLKSAMIVLFSISNACIYIVGTMTGELCNPWLSATLLIITYGILWNTRFNIFYNKFLLKNGNINKS